MLKIQVPHLGSTKACNTGGYKKSYVMEGHGRDTYIASNNGGFTMMHQVSPALQPSTMYYPQNNVLEMLEKCGQ